MTDQPYTAPSAQPAPFHDAPEAAPEETRVQRAEHAAEKAGLVLDDAAEVALPALIPEGAPPWLSNILVLVHKRLAALEGH